MRSLSHEKKPEVRNRVSLYHLSFDTKIVRETRFLFPQRAIALSRKETWRSGRVG